MTKIMLCSKPGGCCPCLMVKDDDGTFRELNAKEIEILKQKIKDGEI